MVPSGTDRPARRPGRPSVISRESVADAALELVAERGIDALTLQNVAARLGVKHSALYRHVDGRADLLRAIADRLVEVTVWPVPDRGWREYLRDVARTIDGVCGRYPGMADLIYNQVWPMPRRVILAALDMIEHLVGLGFSRDLAFTASDLVADFAADSRIRLDRIARFTQHWSGFTDALGGPADEARAGEREAFEAHLADGPQAWVSRKLEVILDGIAVRLDAEQAR